MLSKFRASRCQESQLRQPLHVSRYRCQLLSSNFCTIANAISFDRSDARMLFRNASEENRLSVPVPFGFDTSFDNDLCNHTRILQGTQNIVRHIHMYIHTYVYIEV